MPNLTPHWQDSAPRTDDELPAELAVLERALLADGEHWRRSEPSTARLAEHARALAGLALEEPARTPRASREANPRGTLGSAADRRPAPSRPQRGPGRRSVGAPRWWATIAAVFLIVVLDTAFFALFSIHRPAGSLGPQGTATPQAPTPEGTSTPTIPPFTRETAVLPAQTHLSLPAGGYLSAISFSSAQDGWVGGGINVDDVPGADWSVSKAFLVHYHQGSWTTYPQTFALAGVGPISMLSADEGWAIATHNFDPVTNVAGTSFLLHYTGGQWHEIDDPVFTHWSSDTLVMRSPSFGYATGTDHLQTDLSQAFEDIALWESGKWRLVQTPFWSGEAQIVLFASDDGYALVNHNGQTSFYHFTGGAWNPAAAPSGSGSLYSFTMPSPTSAWVAGTTCGPTATPSPYQVCSVQAFHWNGVAWSQVTGPALPPTLNSVVHHVYGFATIGGQYWLGLTQEDAGQPPAQRQYTTMLSRYDHGQWQAVSLPLAHAMLGITGVGMASSSWDGNGGTWTIAVSENPAAYFVLYTQGGAWQVYGQG